MYHKELSSNRASARRLRRSIIEYWESRGVSADEICVELEERGVEDEPRYEIVSHMVNGLPFGYRVRPDGSLVRVE